MLERSLWRRYFTKSSPPEYFGDNHSYRKAWCIACLDLRIAGYKEQDLIHQRDGENLAIRSEALYRQAAMERIGPIAGKTERFITHMKACRALSEDTRTLALLTTRTKPSSQPRQQTQARTLPSSPPNFGSMNQPSSSPRLHRQTAPNPLQMQIQPPAAKRRRLNSESTETRRLDSLAHPKLQEEFEDDFCEALISTNTAWVAADNSHLRKFIEKWVERPVKLPDRKVVAGRVLMRVANKADSDVVKAVRSDGEKNLATGQSDGWKNVAKAHLVSSVMTVKNTPYLVKTHDVSHEKKTGENLLNLVVEDIKLMEDRFNVEVIAWCTDDGPDGKKMRRLLAAMMPWLIALLCWAHQVNLVVGDFLGAQPRIVNVVTCALELVKWHNNHGTALSLLRQEQIATYDGKALSLLLPAITRWTAHYLTITRLLKIKTAITLCWKRHEETLLTCAGKRAEQRQKAEEIKSIVENAAFWWFLKMIQQLLEPLAIAANITQASHTRLDMVLLTLGNLFRIYTQATTYGDEYKLPILQSLEKRWAKVDQDVYITAVFLNPFVRARLFARVSLTEAALYTIVERVYERLLRTTADLAFEEAFADYYRGEAEFTATEMRLVPLSQKYEKAGKPIDLFFIWSRLDTSSLTGRNGLVKLAMRLHSIIANSAGCERVFSGFGVIHNPHRNRLDPQKVHRTASVKLKHVREDAAHRSKRHFGASNSQITATPIEAGSTALPSATSSARTTPRHPPTDNQPAADPCNFEQHAAELIEEARESQQDDDENPQANHQNEQQPQASTQTPNSRRSSGRTAISLAQLFDHNSSVVEISEGLGLYWKGGLENLEQLTEMHEEVQLEMTQETL